MKDEFADDNTFITKMQLAARLQVTRRTIESWMAKGRVPFRKIGRTVRFHWCEVRQHLDADNRVARGATREKITGVGIASALRERAKEIRKQERKN